MRSQCGIALAFLLFGCATPSTEPRHDSANPPTPSSNTSAASESLDPLARAEGWLAEAADSSDEVSRNVLSTMRKPEVIRIYQTPSGYDALVADAGQEGPTALKLSMSPFGQTWKIAEVSVVEPTLLWPTVELQND